jgi:type VII secretion-associated protein (TIGR03931 family)
VLAVLDLGGGTVDVSVVRSSGPAYEVLATKGDPSFGGADIDQLLLDHVGSVVSATDADAWRTLVEGRELADRRRRRVIHQDVRGAKETLSRHSYTDVPMPPPFPDAHVTRADLERLITRPVERAADLTAATIAAAGLRPADLAGIFLVGGSSRIPLVSQLVHQRCGVVPTTLDQPETVVARGALRATAGEGGHLGGAVPVVGGPGTGGLPVLNVDSPTVQRLPPVRPQPVRRPAAPPRPATALKPLPVPGGSRRTQLLLVGGGSALVAVVAIVLVLVLGNQPDPRPRAAPTTTATTGTQQPSRLIAQYEYQFALPDGWLQTGGDASKLRTEVKPADAQRGDDVVLVEEIRLSFDSTADRPRAVDKLRGDYENAGDAFSGFEERATFAGRDVIHYRQALPNKQATVDWYVLFEGRTQVSVGCQHVNEGDRRDTVTTACETIVGSLRITG